MFVHAATYYLPCLLLLSTSCAGCWLTCPNMSHMLGGVWLSSMQQESVQGVVIRTLLLLPVSQAGMLLCVQEDGHSVCVCVRVYEQCVQPPLCSVLVNCVVCVCVHRHYEGVCAQSACTELSVLYYAPAYYQHS